MQTIIKKIESLFSVKNTPSSEEKELFQKTQDFIQFIQWIPGLRMIAVSNSLAMYATHKESDIDLFIITAPNRLWIVRTLVLIMATLLGVRVEPDNEAGQFCFPFFMTEKNLSLREIAIENDVYLAYWIMTLKPIYNQYYTYGRFMEVNKIFYEDILQLDLSPEERTLLLEKNRMFLVLTRRHEYLRKIGPFFSPILSFIDMILEIISMKFISIKIPTKEIEGIIINNDMIKLHFNDRREEFQKKILEQY